MKRILLLFLSLLAITVAVADNDKSATYSAKGIFCGNVTLDVTQAADGNYYLYDSKRNIYTLIGAYLPSVDSMVATGTVKNYLPDYDIPANPTKSDMAQISHQITNDAQLYLKYILSANQPLDLKEHLSPYRLTGVTINEMRDTEANKNLMAEAGGINVLRVEMYYKYTKNAYLFHRMKTDPVVSPVVFDDLKDQDRILPREGVTLVVTGAKVEDGIQTSAKVCQVFFKPDASGKTEIDQDGLKATITYEPYQSPLVDIHYGMARTLDFYKDVFKYNSYDGKGAPVYNLAYLPGMMFPVANFSLSESASRALTRADGDNTDAQYDYGPVNIEEITDQAGAFATGTTTTAWRMLFGSGGYVSGSTAFMRSACELSILCHEFTHLINQATAKLGSSDEEGAINESFSDIMAVSMAKSEYGYGADEPWKVGGHNVIVGKSCLRDMANPKNCLDGEMCCPTTYNGDNWDKDNKYNMMAIQNLFYSLLCDGGTGTNDNGYQYAVEGIGLEKGRQIAFNTLTQEAAGVKDFAGIRVAFLSAARKLYGNDSPEAVAVGKAWDAVGVYENGIMPTGIYTLRQQTETGDQTIYDLQGRRVTSPTPGIYIKNGRKVVIK